MQHKTRDHNIDLLRILCMVMVVLTHSFNLGGTQQLEDLLIPGTPNWFLGTIVFSPCLVAVNTFVLISGYYLSTSKFRLSKIAQIWLETAFYSLGLYLVSLKISGGYFSC